MQKFSLHYHSFVLITPLYHPVRLPGPDSHYLRTFNNNPGFNEQMRPPGPVSANSLVWLSIIFTKDVAGARRGRG